MSKDFRKYMTKEEKERYDRLVERYEGLDESDFVDFEEYRRHRSLIMGKIDNMEERAWSRRYKSDKDRL